MFTAGDADRSALGLGFAPGFNTPPGEDTQMNTSDTLRPSRGAAPRALATLIRTAVAAAAISLATAAQAGSAAESTLSFHLMQIEAAIGGVNGDTTAQAVELRTRSGFQNFIQGTKIVAYDAAGLNPVTLITFPSNISNSGAGVRILVASASFVGNSSPNAQPDFMMTNLIPPSYLAAGRITFEDSFGAVLWSLAYGGSNYTGPTNGTLDNDLDGEFGPPFAGPLPSTSTSSLHFQGLASDRSTNNFDDYRVTPAPAVFFNAAGSRFAVGDGSVFGFEVVGHCPGTINLTWSGATVGRQIAIIFAANRGSVVIPPGNPCDGTQLGLGAQSIQLVQTIGSGTNGINSINGNTSSGACGRFLQLLDLDTCRTSNVEMIP